MKYYKLSLRVASESFGNDFSYEEITEEKFNKLKERFKATAGYRFAEESVSETNDMTWDLNYNTRYLTAIATDENFDYMKKAMFQKIYNFVKDTIDWKVKQIEELTSEVKILSEHPIYDAITKANMREEKINQILN